MANLLQSRWMSGGLVTQPDTIAGQCFCVDNTNGSNTNSGRDWKHALSTLNYAISLCADDSGDVIYLAPWHAETIDGAGTASGATTDECVIDKCAIQIRGLGSGSLRPTFTIGDSDTAAAFVVTAATTNIVLDNVILISGLADTAAGLTLTATSDGATIQNWEFRSGLGGSLELVIGITIAAECNDVSILNCNFFTEAGNCASAITCAGASNDLLVDHCWMQGTFSVSALTASAGASTDMLILHSTFTNQGAAALELNTSCTGVVAYCNIAGTTSIAAAWTGDNAMYCCENYVTGEDGGSGLINPTVAS